MNLNAFQKFVAVVMHRVFQSHSRP